MALTEETVLERIDIDVRFCALQVRHALVIKRDGVEVSRQGKRKVFHCDQDVSGEMPQIIAVANALWTQEVKDAWAAHKAAFAAQE